LCTKKSGSRAIAPGRGGWEGFDVRRAFRKSAMTTPVSSARNSGRGAVFAASARGPQPDLPRRIPRARNGRHRRARGVSPELSARRLIPRARHGRHRTARGASTELSRRQAEARNPIAPPAQSSSPERQRHERFSGRIIHTSRSSRRERRTVGTRKHPSGRILRDKMVCCVGVRGESLCGMSGLPVDVSRTGHASAAPNGVWVNSQGCEPLVC
jgi:hypothetical protein